MDGVSASYSPTAGAAFPLGAHAHPLGTRFAVHAPRATSVELCLVDADGPHPIDRPGAGDRVERRIRVPDHTYGVWHVDVPDIGPGQRYGYRVDGPWDPHRGLRFNPNKVLLDPYARRIDGGCSTARSTYAYAGDDPFGPPSTTDSLQDAALGVVTPQPQLAPGDGRLHTTWSRTVIYEVHVGSLTARHPGVPEYLRGTFLGVSSPAMVEHLLGLGVTAVELLPVQAFLTEPSVLAREMRNHWGYSPAAWFAPHPGYATAPGREVEEFARMVAELHAAGIEVIMDVVYNHTCESGVAGPSLSWRGFDAPGYYLLDDSGRDVDLTGCGNTVNPATVTTARLVTDSLRYWATVFDVDGFRFDLASVLGRPGGGAFDAQAALLVAIAADPILSDCKLIAEPWDATAEGHRTGGFDTRWSEWNDRYRDTVRNFWASGSGVDRIASRLAGSADIFAAGGRHPWASVNFVTAHDGFTVRDLVSYREKHNMANGEDNRDGTTNNTSVNHGVEGPTDDPAILEERDRHVRALLSSLALSAGTPMLLAGDELGHSQNGNNNAYCVPLTTPAQEAFAIDWESADHDLAATVAEALRIRRRVPALQRHDFFTGSGDLEWFDAHGNPMTVDGWNDHTIPTIQAWYHPLPETRAGGLPTSSGANPTMVVILHAGDDADLILPEPDGGVVTLHKVFDSTAPTGTVRNAEALKAGDTLEVSGPCVIVLVGDD